MKYYQAARENQTGAQAGSYLSPYGAQSMTADSSTNGSSGEGSDSTSPGLRIKKSMPNLNHLNGPTVSRDPTRLIPQRSSGNLRDYSTIGNGPRRSFAPGNINTSGPTSAGQTFNSLFGAPVDGSGHTLGNGTSFEPSPSPTSPAFPMDAQMGPAPPLVHTSSGGLIRNPRGPQTDSKGFGSRTLRSLGGSNGNLRGQNNAVTGVIGQRPLSVSAGAVFGTIGSIAVRSDSTSVHTSGSSSSVIEEEGEISEGHSDFSGRH